MPADSGTYILYSTVILSIVAGLLSYHAATRIVSPLTHLLIRIRRFPELSTRIFPNTGIDEINELYFRVEEFMTRIKGQIRDLKLEKELLSILLNSLRDGVLCLNSEGIVIFQNEILDEDLVTKNSEGKPYFKIVRNPRMLETIAEQVRQNQQNLGGVNSSSNLSTTQKSKKLPDGAAAGPVDFTHFQKSFQMQCTPIRMENRLELFLIIVHDNTRERNMKRLREDFLQNASHELKTPITSIRGYSETLLYRVDNDRDKNFVNAILRNAGRMERLIEDMVTISSLESGSFPFNPEPIEMEQYLKGIDELIAGIIDQKSQKVVYTVKQPGLKINADPLLIEHLLINLLSNASRYSPENTNITVECGRWEMGQAHYISVTDEGPGISEDFNQKIFERFFRVDRNRSRVEGGTGLGLSIVRQITKIHGGNVQVENVRPSGSKFTVLLPD